MKFNMQHEHRQRQIRGGTGSQIPGGELHEGGGTTNERKKGDFDITGNKGRSGGRRKTPKKKADRPVRPKGNMDWWNKKGRINQKFQKPNGCRPGPVLRLLFG